MKVLVAVFSAEGRTGKLARQAASHMGWDFFEIQSERPYTKADIRWTNPFSRCNKEKLGKREVPVKGIVDHFDQYDAVLIGFPIWYGCAPNVVNTFCSGYDFTGKKVALFATSGGSGIAACSNGHRGIYPAGKMKTGKAAGIVNLNMMRMFSGLTGCM